MAVAYDAVSESTAGTGGDTSGTSFNWTHTPSGTPAGVFVIVHMALSSTDECDGVTYGGVAMTDTGLTAADTSGEPGRVTLWFLSAPSSGAQTVVVSRTLGASMMNAQAVTVTSATGATAVAVDYTTVDTAATAEVHEINVDDGSPGANSVRFMAMHWGNGTPPGAGANSTSLGYIKSSGSNCMATCYETTAGQGDRPVGYENGATKDDLGAIYFCIYEASAGGGTHPQGVFGRVFHGPFQGAIQ